MTPSEKKLTSTDHPFAIENVKTSRKENHNKRKGENINNVQEAEVALISRCRPAVQSPHSSNLDRANFSHFFSS